MRNPRKRDNHTRLRSCAGSGTEFVDRRQNPLWPRLRSVVAEDWGKTEWADGPGSRIHRYRVPLSDGYPH